MNPEHLISRIEASYCPVVILKSGATSLIVNTEYDMGHGVCSLAGMQVSVKGSWSTATVNTARTLLIQPIGDSFDLQDAWKMENQEARPGMARISIDKRFRYTGKLAADLTAFLNINLHFCFGRYQCSHHFAIMEQPNG